MKRWLTYSVFKNRKGGVDRHLGEGWNDVVFVLPFSTLHRLRPAFATMSCFVHVCVYLAGSCSVAAVLNMMRGCVGQDCFYRLEFSSFLEWSRAMCVYKSA